MNCSRSAALLGLIASAFLSASAQQTAAPAPTDKTPLISNYMTANVTALPSTLSVDPFYKKYADALGIPVLSSEKVPDSALLVARDIVIHMLSKRVDIRDAMIAKGMKVEVMALSEGTMDLPEHRNWKKPALTDRRLTDGEREHYDRIAAMTDAQYWNSRARGMGGNPTSCAEENLLGYPGTRYFGENIFVHEFSHGIMGTGIKNADPALYQEILDAYKHAKDTGLWKNSYGANTEAEYWAEGTQFWFYSNIVYYDGNTRIATPEDMAKYDPRLNAILAKVYPDHHIPMDVYYAKEAEPRGHRPGDQPAKTTGQ